MTMNYEEKYNEVLKSMRDLYNKMKYLSSTDALETTVTLENTFPELKESEDERIKKEIIQFLQLPHPQFVGKRNYEEWISWLEKQGEQKPSWSEEDENMRQDIISGLKAQIQSIYAHDEHGKAQMNNRIDWLKSLKPNHWKPSKEQMEALKKRTHGLHTSSETRKALESLINDLEKL